MVKIVGKIDLDSDKEKKLKTFRDRIVEIMSRSKNNLLPLGRVLHEADMAKAEIKKTFPEYEIAKEDRKTKTDNFNWIRFFDENLRPEFEVVSDHNWSNGKISDALYYKPRLENNPSKNTLENNVTITEMKSKPKDQRPEQPTAPKVESEVVAAPAVETRTNDKIIDLSEAEVTTVSQEKVSQLLKTLLTELNNGLFEKERSIRLTLLAVLAGESTFMLGEPGTAKSLVARRISEAFEDTCKDGEIKFFDYLMNQFSTPEEIFGPVSIQELKNDSYVRKTECYLPKAQFAFLDEIWKANPAIQNALLTILNEKIFRNGVQVEKVPLIGFMSASNELPEKGKGLEAIFDRFLLRIFEKPISDNSNFRSMISAERKTAVNISKKLTNSIIEQILSESEAVEISDQCFDIIDSVRKILTKKNSEITDETEKYLVSDRRWKKIANLMRVSAYCNNRIETDVMDATLIADCIWSTEKQESEVQQILSDAIKNFGMSSKSDVNDVKNKVKEFESKVDDSFYKEVVTNRTPIVKQINRVNFYEVRELNSKDTQPHYISCNQFDSRNWGYYPNKKVYYLDSKDNEIEASFDKATYTLTDRTQYQVQFDGGTAQLVKRDDFSEQMLAATIKSFNEDADNIEKEIQNTIKAIDDEKRAQEEQYNSNLFSDSDYYSNVIFQEQIKAKTQLNKLSKELDNQRKRYQ